MALVPRPLTDEEAKAVQSLSTLGVTVVEEGGQLGRYMSRVLGTVPHDLVGVTIGEHLHFIRTAIALSYDLLLTKIFKERDNPRTEPVSPSLAIPLLRAAYEESRPELQEIWARLIASAMDPMRAGRVRIGFIETLKRFDPLDALVLKTRYDNPEVMKPNATARIAELLGSGQEDVQVSVDNLRALNCIGGHGSVADFYVSNYGRALIRACLD